MPGFKFPCTQCGLCCTNAGGERQLSFLKDEGLLNKEGKCVHLEEDLIEGRLLRRCGVYKDRPLLCRTDVAEKLTRPKAMARLIFWRLTALGCNILQEQNGFDESYRVKIPASSLTEEESSAPTQSDE